MKVLWDTSVTGDLRRMRRRNDVHDVQGTGSFVAGMDSSWNWHIRALESSPSKKELNEQPAYQKISILMLHPSSHTSFPSFY